MQVQFREQTPGVRAGEWWDAESGLHHSVVTIQSLDGWVAYIGDKRVGNEFATHEEAANFAISKLKSNSRRRAALRRVVSFGAPAVAIVLLAFGGYGYLYGEVEQISEQGGGANSKIVSRVTTPAPTVDVSKDANESSAANKHSAQFAGRANSVSSVEKRARAEQASLPQINEKRAVNAPWEKSLSELATASDKATTAVYTNVESMNESEYAADKKRWDADLLADMRADEAERETFIEQDKPLVTHSRAVVDDEFQADTGSLPNTTMRASPAARDVEAKDSKQKLRNKKQKVKKAKARKRYRRHRNRRKVATPPLVKKVVRRNHLGQRYVVYKARRPRNAREYRALQRLKRKLIAKQRRRQRQNFGY